jgi:TP901 family phage tail tape measure protein
MAQGDYSIHFTAVDKGLQKQLENTRKQLKAAGKAADDLSTIKEQFEKIKNSCMPAQKKVEQLKQLLLQLKVSGQGDIPLFKNIMQQAQQAKKEVEQLKKEAAKIDFNVGGKNFASKLKGQLSGIFNGIGSKIGVGNLGSMLAGVAGPAAIAVTGVTLLTKGLKESTKAGMELQDALASLKSITGTTKRETEEIGNVAIEMSKKFRASSVEIVDSMRIAGAKMPQLLKDMKALTSVTNEALVLSEAAGISIEDSIKGLSNVINQFGLKADEAKDVINVLAAGSRNGSGDVAYLSFVFEKAGTAANMAGLSYLELAAAIETIAPYFSKAEEAGTGLRGVLLKLEAQANDKFKPSVVGVTQAFKNLNEANMSTTAKVKLFGLESINVANQLMQNVSTLETFIDTMSGTNTAYEQMNINMNTLEGSLSKLKTAWDALMLNLQGEDLDGGSGWFKELVDCCKDIIEHFEKMNKMFDTTSSTGASMNGFVLLLKGTMWILAFVVDIVVAAFKGFGLMLSMMLGPMALFIEDMAKMNSEVTKAGEKFNKTREEFNALSSDASKVQWIKKNIKLLKELGFQLDETASDTELLAAANAFLVEISDETAYALSRTNEILAEAEAESNKAIDSFNKLAEGYRLCRTEGEKIQYINDHKEAIDKLKTGINGVNDADKQFIEQSETVIKLLQARAKAAGLSKAMEGVWKEYYESKAEIDKGKATYRYDMTPEQARIANPEVYDIAWKRGLIERVTDENGNYVLTERTIANLMWLQNQIYSEREKQFQNLRDKVVKPLENEHKQVLSDVAQYESELNINTGNDDNSGGGSGDGKKDKKKEKPKPGSIGERNEKIAALEKKLKNEKLTAEQAAKIRKQIDDLKEQNAKEEHAWELSYFDEQFKDNIIKQQKEKDPNFDFDKLSDEEKGKLNEEQKKNHKGYNEYMSKYYQGKIDKETDPEKIKELTASRNKHDENLDIIKNRETLLSLQYEEPGELSDNEKKKTVDESFQGYLQQYKLGKIDYSEFIKSLLELKDHLKSIGIGEEFMDSLNEQLNIKEGSKQWYDQEKAIWEAKKNAAVIGSAEYMEALSNINSLTKKQEKDENNAKSPEEKKAEQLGKTADMIGKVGDAFSSMGSAFELPALDVAGTIAQAVANMMLSYSSASAQAGGINPFFWAGFTLTGLAQVMGIITTMKSAGAFADGGIIGGSSFAGDRLYARVNSGEMILNTSQQAKLFNMINGGVASGNRNNKLEFKLKGSTLKAATTNYDKRINKIR